MSGACGDGRSKESRSISMGKSRDMSWFGSGMIAWLIVIPRRRYNIISRGMGKRCRQLTLRWRSGPSSSRDLF